MNPKAPDRIRILHVIASLVGGAAEHLYELLSHTDKQKYLLHLACPRDFPSMSRRLDALNLAWTPLDIHSGFKMRDLAKLVDIVRHHEINILHCHGIRAGAYARLAVLLCGIGCHSVYTVHGFHPEFFYSGLKRRIALRWERELATRASDRIICVSDSDRRAVEKCLKGSAVSDLITVIPNGIDSDRYATCFMAGHRRTTASRGEPMVLGTLGRLRPQKSVETLLEVARLLKERGWRFKMLIAGEGYLRSALEEKLEMLSLRQEVELIGYCERVPEFLKSLDVFLLASLWEGLPIALLEAMAAGIPIVATDVPGTSELLRPIYGDNLVPPRDPEAFVRCLQNWKDHPDEYRSLAVSAQDYVRRSFSVKEMVQSTENVYDGLHLAKRTRLTEEITEHAT